LRAGFEIEQSGRADNPIMLEAMHE
jgi:hypothetical protein